MSSETMLLALECSDCGEPVICTGDPKDNGLRCPPCAARDATTTELSIALRARILSTELRDACSGINDRAVRDQVWRAARDLRELAAHLALRHGVGGAEK